MSVREQCSVACQLLVWPVSSFGLVELLIEHRFVVSSSALKHRVRVELEHRFVVSSSVLKHREGLTFYRWITTDN